MRNFIDRSGCAKDSWYLTFGNQWLHTYYSSDIQDEWDLVTFKENIGIEAGTSDIEAGELVYQFNAGHFAVVSSAFESISSAMHKGGIFLYPAGTAEHLPDNANPAIDVPQSLLQHIQWTGRNKSWSVVLSEKHNLAFLVSSRKRDKLLRVLESVTLTINAPVVGVALNGKISTGVGPSLIDIFNSALNEAEQFRTIADWILTHMHSGKLRVRIAPGTSSFVPTVARDDNSPIVVSAMLAPGYVTRIPCLVSRCKNEGQDVESSKMDIYL